MIRLKNLFYNMALLCLVALITGCGEMFQQEWPEDFDPEKLPDITGLGADDGGSLTLYVGDEYKLDPQVGEYMFSKADEEVQKIVLSRFHASAGQGDKIVKVRQIDITAMGVGKDVISFSDGEGDWTVKMPVTVLPVWTKVRVPVFRYETIVYAEVTVDDKAPAGDMMFAALCGDDLRGRGVSRTVKGITYMVFRIGSNTASGETIRFEGYDPTSGNPITFDETLTFDGATHGTLSDLFELKGKK